MGIGWHFSGRSPCMVARITDLVVNVVARWALSHSSCGSASNLGQRQWHLVQKPRFYFKITQILHFTSQGLLKTLNYTVHNTTLKLSSLSVWDVCYSSPPMSVFLSFIRLYISNKIRRFPGVVKRLSNFLKECQQALCVPSSFMLAIIQTIWLELKHLFWTMGEHAKVNGTGKGSQVLDGLELPWRWNTTCIWTL